MRNERKEPGTKPGSSLKQKAMKSTDLLNKEVIVRRKNGDLYSRKCEVLEVIGRTKIRVRDIDRGPGWNEYLQKYSGVRKPGNWSRGENHSFGNEFTVHVKYVELIKRTEQ